MGAGNFVANNTRVICNRLSVTTPVICLTATGYTQVVGIRLVNISPSAVPNVGLFFKPIQNPVTFCYQANYPLQVTTALWYPFDAFGVNEGDQIIAQSSIASTVDVFIFIAEVPGRSQ